jgi:transposase
MMNLHLVFKVGCQKWTPDLLYSKQPSQARPEYLARVLGFARSTVFGWMALYRERGLGVLKAQTLPGRPQKLSGPRLRQIYTLIAGNDPHQLSFEFALWTREMVRELIRHDFNVRLSVVSVGLLLRKLGLSP